MIIIIQCRDQVGLVASVSGALAKSGLNILSLREFVDQTHNRFFLRIETDQGISDQSLMADLKKRLPADAEISINPRPEKKIVVLVTKEYHCLGDILVRNYFKTLGATLQSVIGNHSTLDDICRRFDIPFYHVPFENGGGEKFEAEVLEILKDYSPDYIILAKFMRILSPSFVARFPVRIINIHHSFLPAFTGAHPYRQAYERGVKLIGATAHFVTNDLDEGPIIAQQIIPVTHSFTVKDMVRAGKEIERAVLSRALDLVFGEYVLVYRNKTIIFE